MPAQEVIARFTFSRPPVTVTPERFETVSTFAKRVFLSAAVLSVGHALKTNKAAPATWGVAIEVPLANAYEFPKYVDKMLTPGAPKWTVAEPKFEKLANASFVSVAATVIWLALVKLAGYVAVTSSLAEEFPAATTKSMSLAPAELISSSRAWENPLPPQLLESTRMLTGVLVEAKKRFT